MVLIFIIILCGTKRMPTTKASTYPSSLKLLFTAFLVSSIYFMYLIREQTDFGSWVQTYLYAFFLYTLLRQFGQRTIPFLNNFKCLFLFSSFMFYTLQTTEKTFFLTTFHDKPSVKKLRVFYFLFFWWGIWKLPRVLFHFVVE